MATRTRPVRHCFSKKHAALLTALAHADSSQRSALLRSADLSFVRCICECALNVLEGNIKISNHSKNKLKKHVHVLRRLINNQDNFRKKKKVLLQSGGSFLPALLAPLLATLVSRLFDRSNNRRNGESP